MKNKPFDAIRYIEKHRLATVVADACGISRQAASQWRRVPAVRAIAVAKALGVTRHMIRPGLYPGEE